MRSFVLAGFLFFASMAAGQNGFTGLVTASGSPVAGARVTLFTPNLGQFFEARTAGDGRYTISDVPPMSYRMGVAKVNLGYQEIQVDTNGGMQTVDFALQPETHPGQWSTAGNTLPEFLDATDIAVLLANGKIFYCHDTVDPILFDPVTGLKTFPAGFWLPSGCMNGTLGIDGKVFFAGGQEGNDPGSFTDAVRYVRTYDPATNSWQRLPDLLQENGRWYPGFARLADGSYLVMGGGTRPKAERTDTCEWWNPVTQSWSWTGSMLNPAEFPPAALLHNGKVLITWSPPQLFNLATETWTATGDFVQPDRGWPNHSDHSIIVLSDGRVAAIGVRKGPGNNQFMGEIYNPLTERWSLTSNPGLVRLQPEVVQLPDGRIFVGAGEGEGDLGGIPNTLGIVKWTDLYDPSTNAWRRMADMNHFREYHAVTLLVPDGRVLTTGGTRIKFQFGPTSAGVEAFSPPYLFRGVRPRIGKLASTLIRGSRQKITITPATRITSVVLIGTQSTTHWVDGGIPRRVVLRPGQVGNTVTFDLPSNTN
ncbi:MAG: carboxypeptidase regulatory-like domain-containing protein, partial [Armatimonadetes bacterium]|nr:carboxypeptidase regulatory-like domain-containing protein [Armatimonadota bacterium]